MSTRCTITIVPIGGRDLHVYREILDDWIHVEFTPAGEPYGRHVRVFPTGRLWRRWLRR